MRAAESVSGRVPVEDFDELRTKLGEKRVSARGGWAGEKRDFFSFLPLILLRFHLLLLDQAG